MEQAYWRKLIDSILQNLAKASLNRSALLAAVVAFSIFHFPFSTFADSSVWNAVEAGHLTWSNATTNWVDGDLVITYKTERKRA